MSIESDFCLYKPFYFYHYNRFRTDTYKSNMFILVNFYFNVELNSEKYRHTQFTEWHGVNGLKGIEKEVVFHEKFSPHIL